MSKSRIAAPMLAAFLAGAVIGGFADGQDASAQRTKAQRKRKVTGTAVPNIMPSCFSGFKENVITWKAGNPGSALKYACAKYFKPRCGPGFVLESGPQVGPAGPAHGGPEVFVVAYLCKRKPK